MKKSRARDEKRMPVSVRARKLDWRGWEPKSGWIFSSMTMIRSACYSNIHVYEMQVRGIPLMIRKGDSYVNATQILRAAGLPKPARTKVLEREVTRGVHEKVQGGYAGSQGTWIPLPAARTLAQQYGIEEECAPLFDYDMASGVAELVSPPLKVRRQPAPKQHVDSDLSSSDEKRPRYTGRQSRLRKPTVDYDDDDDDGFDSSGDERRRKYPRKQNRVSVLANEMNDVEMSRMGSSAFSMDPNRKCEVCGASETPQWRRGPGGKRTLCNACGVKWSSGRLTLPTAPGSPFPFNLTESEHVESSDPTSGFEDIEVGSTAWKLQLEVSRLKSKLREVERNHKKLVKLLNEGMNADRQIDKCYRKLLSVAKKASPKTYPIHSLEYNNLFRKTEMDLYTVPKEIRFGDQTTRDMQIERSLISQFLAVAQST